MKLAASVRFDAVALCLSAALGTAAAVEGGEMGKPPVPTPWDMKALANPPKVHPAPSFKADGVRALFYEGLPWKGKPTRVFAWHGVPAAPAKAPFPAMILVHGGGGTAFDDWVRLWTQRGYAAISMDTCGCTAGGEHMKRPRHEFGGPPGWGGYDQIDQPIEDQWMFHAVADCILATSLVRSFPEVDPERIGMTGISWGGILACIAAGVDPRLRFVAPVYGCGHLGDDPNRLVQQMPDPAGRERWFALWDPSHYLDRAKMPMLWVTGTNDFAFPLPMFQRSYRQPRGPRTLSVRVAMVHGQPQGTAPEEIAAMADSLFRGGPPLAQITSQGVTGRSAWAAFASARPITRADFNFTCDKGLWQERKWRSVAAELSAATGKAQADLPDGATAYYFNLVDDRGLTVSTEHETAENGQ